MGHIYVLSHRHMPGLLKIGHTERSVRERVAELSSHTGVPGRFRVEMTWTVENSYDVEQAIHYELDEYRVEKEFFRITIPEVARCIEGLVGYPDDTTRTAGSEAKRVKKTEEEARKVKLRYMDQFVKTGVGYIVGQEYLDLASKTGRSNYLPLIKAWNDFNHLDSSESLDVHKKVIQEVNSSYQSVFLGNSAIDEGLYLERLIKTKQEKDKEKKDEVFAREVNEINTWANGAGDLKVLSSELVKVVPVAVLGYIVGLIVSDDEFAQKFAVSVAVLAFVYIFIIVSVQNWSLKTRRMEANKLISELKNKIYGDEA